MDSSQDENSEREKVFAILIFGNLGSSACLSYESILQNHKSRICVACDKAGANWIKINTPIERFNDICFHAIPEHLLLELGLNSLDTDTYSNFGQERFIKLTTFKWYLLLDILIKHLEVELVVFSDLDVLWFKKPLNDPFRLEVNKNCVSLIQDDTPIGATEYHFCTGIMFWKSSSKSIEILTKLFESQLRYNSIGKLVPDEPVLNQYWSQSENKSIFKILDLTDFVIGNRFFHLFFSRTYRHSQLTAFHANYVLGEKRKFRRLRALQMLQQGRWTWILLLFLEIQREMFLRIILKISSTNKPKKK
jgi:Nucleotide-diphospho-sugar transferase